MHAELRVGQTVSVRTRTWLVEDLEPSVTCSKIAHLAFTPLKVSAYKYFGRKSWTRKYWTKLRGRRLTREALIALSASVRICVLCAGSAL